MLKEQKASFVVFDRTSQHDPDTVRPVPGNRRHAQAPHCSDQCFDALPVGAHGPKRPVGTVREPDTAPRDESHHGGWSVQLPIVPIVGTDPPAGIGCPARCLQRWRARR
jgi:hypothetical protein